MHVEEQAPFRRPFMARHTISQTLIPIVGAAVAGPGLVMVISLLGAIVRQARMLLPSLLPTEIVGDIKTLTIRL
jgi:hypothetical protein